MGPDQTKEEKCFMIILTLSEGKHYFRFLVDGEYKHLENKKKVKDADGNYSNEIIVDSTTSHVDGMNNQKNLNISSNQKKKSLKERYRKLPHKPPPINFPDDFGQKKQIFVETKKTPPLLPPHLKFTTLIVTRALQQTEISIYDDKYTLPIPLHVTLNRIYFAKIRNEKLKNLNLVGLTKRFGPYDDRKYATIHFFYYVKPEKKKNIEKKKNMKNEGDLKVESVDE